MLRNSSYVILLGVLLVIMFVPMVRNGKTKAQWIREANGPSNDIQQCGCFHLKFWFLNRKAGFPFISKTVFGRFLKNYSKNDKLCIIYDFLKVKFRTKKRVAPRSLTQPLYSSRRYSSFCQTEKKLARNYRELWSGVKAHSFAFVNWRWLKACNTSKVDTRLRVSAEMHTWIYSSD